MRKHWNILQMASRAAGLAGAVIVLGSAPSMAHHSFAMFDGLTTKQIEGVVKDFQWTNPHAWLDITVAGPNGEETWSFEMGSTGALSSQGVRPRSIVKGEKATVTYHPMRDGTKGGQFLAGDFGSGFKIEERGSYRPLQAPPGAGGQAPAGGPPAGAPPAATN